MVSVRASVGVEVVVSVVVPVRILGHPVDVVSVVSDSVVVTVLVVVVLMVVGVKLVVVTVARVIVR